MSEPKSDTPHTDTESCGCNGVTAEFARQLERELALEHEQWRMTAERLETVERELAEANDKIRIAEVYEIGQNNRLIEAKRVSDAAERLLREAVIERDQWKERAEGYKRQMEIEVETNVKLSTMRRSAPEPDADEAAFGAWVKEYEPNENESLADDLRSAWRAALSHRDNVRDRLRAALELIWHLHIKKEVHLGLERRGGIEHGCIPCICFCALNKEGTIEEFKTALVAHRDKEKK